MLDLKIRTEIYSDFSVGILDVQLATLELYNYMRPCEGRKKRRIEAEDALLAFLPTLHHHSIAAELAS